MKMLASPPGPVHISLPLNIQRTEVRLPWDQLDASVYAPGFVDLLALEWLWKLSCLASHWVAPARIVALAGAGVEKSRATIDLLAFAERFEIPVATTLRAKGVFPEDHRLSLGNLW